MNIYTTIKGKVAEREIEMKQSVTAEAAELTKKLDEIFLSVDKFIHKEMNTIQNYERDLNLKRTMLERALNSCQAISVLNTVG